MGQMWPFVGREREIRALEAIHDNSKTLAGAAGVGKTRPAREAVAQAAGPQRRAADRLLAEVLEFRGNSAEAAGVLPGVPPAAWALTSAGISHWGLAQDAERSVDEMAHGRDLVEASRSWILLFDGRCEEALAAAERVLAAPGAEPQARIWAAASGAAAAGLLGRAVRAAQIHQDGRALVASTGDRYPWAAAQVGYGGCLALLALGMPRPAGRMAEDGYRAAVRAQAPSMAGVWAAFMGLAARAAGRVTAARSALHEAVVLMEGEDVYRLRRPWMAELATTTALLGAPEPARRRLALAEGCERGGGRLFEPWLELSRAWNHAASGALSKAARCAVNAGSLAEDRGQPTYAAVALYDAARLGAAAAVHERLSELATRLEGELVPAMALAAKGLATGDGSLMEEALPVFADLGHNLLAAEIASAAAEAHRKAGLWARAGLLVERAAAFAARCEGARTPLLAPRLLHSSLTPREREVALMALTLSSREIAKRLGLSPRTVDNYLQRAYGKLGISGRRDLRAGLER